MADPDKSCFIIMPITTPEAFFDVYRDGPTHFQHVLECLFVPSVQRAGFAAQPPIAKGSDLIHAEIIRHLESADLVLCDMSCLNPNVFFELGIRTSLNKPVCLVRDEHTTEVPFDTGILNHHEYKSSLEAWELEAEIAQLIEHLRASEESSEGKNTLWNILGMRAEARPYEGKTGPDAKLDYLALQVESLRKKIDDLREPERIILPSPQRGAAEKKADAERFVRRHTPRSAVLVLTSFPRDDTLLVKYWGSWPTEEMYPLSAAITEEFGLRVEWERLDFSPISSSSPHGEAPPVEPEDAS